MRVSPAVSLPIADDLPWRSLQAALFALAAASLAAWLTQRAGWAGSACGAAALLSGGAAAVFGWWLARQVPSRLAWTGAHWQWSLADVDHILVTAPDVMLDLGPWMLLRLRLSSARAPRWLTARPAGDAPRWAAFRAAVYSSASGPNGSSAVQRPRS